MQHFPQCVLLVSPKQFFWQHTLFWLCIFSTNNKKRALPPPHSGFWRPHHRSGVLELISQCSKLCSCFSLELDTFSCVTVSHYSVVIGPGGRQQLSTSYHYQNSFYDLNPAHYPYQMRKDQECLWNLSGQKKVDFQSIEVKPNQDIKISSYISHMYMYHICQMSYIYLYHIWHDMYHTVYMYMYMYHII